MVRFRKTTRRIRQMNSAVSFQTKYFAYVSDLSGGWRDFNENHSFDNHNDYLAHLPEYHMPHTRTNIQHMSQL